MSGERRIRPSRVVFSALVLGAVVWGYVREQRSRVDPGAGFRFQPEERPRFEPLERPGGEHALDGEVLTDGGEPVAGAQVFLHRAEPDATSAEPQHLAFTDEAGRFRLEELAATRYGVVLEAHGHAPETREVEVPLAGGERVAWTLAPALAPLPALPEMRRADLDGVVQAPPGGSAEGYEAVLRPAETTDPLSGAVVRRARADADGRFRFEAVVATDYALELLPPWAAGGSWPVLARLAFEHSPERDFAPTLVPRAGRVAGRVVDAQGQPVEGALARVDAPDPDEAGRRRLWPPVATGSDGRFEVTDLVPGRYRVRLHTGHAIEERELDVAAGDVLDLGDVEMSPGGDASEAGAPADGS